MLMDLDMWQIINELELFSFDDLKIGMHIQCTFVLLSILYKGGQLADELFSLLLMGKVFPDRLF